MDSSDPSAHPLAPGRTPEDVAKIVQQALDTITDPDVIAALKPLLTTPKLIQCEWDYGERGQTFPAWIVLEHPPSGTGIAYSDFGFGPQTPWGLIWLTHSGFGMDSGWYNSLDGAFVESRASEGLRIWDIVKTNVDHSVVEITETSLTLTEAIKKSAELNAPLRDNPLLIRTQPFYTMKPRTTYHDHGTI
jgi:hypothetical protein